MSGIETLKGIIIIGPSRWVKAGEILKSLGIRSRGVNIISCPLCRQAFPVETEKYWKN